MINGIGYTDVPVSETKHFTQNSRRGSSSRDT